MRQPCVIKGYCSANEDGNYLVSFESSSPNVTLRVALFGFETVEKIIEVKTQRVDVTMVEKTTELKDVVVVADKITQRGDTISYLVAPYKDEKDRVIGDVIKKMLTGNYSLNMSQQIINSEPVDFKSQFWSTNLMFATTPARWMGAALGFAYGESKSFTELNKTKAPIVRQYSGRLDLNFFLVQRMVANFATENNYTNMTDGGRNSLFCDLKLIYKFMKCDVEFEFNNIFNRKQFSRVSYDGMNIYRNVYDLRPRNFMVKVRFNIL